LQLRILKRPDSGGTDNAKTRESSKDKPIHKTLAERQAQYAEARYSCRKRRKLKINFKYKCRCYRSKLNSGKIILTWFDSQFPLYSNPNYS